MSDAAKVEAWVRGRFVPLPGATVTPMHANASTVRLPRTDDMARALRVPRMDVASLPEELVLSIDGEECAQALVSGESPDFIKVTALC